MSDKELELIIKEKEARKLELKDKLKKLELLYDERASRVSLLESEIIELDTKLQEILPDKKKKAFLAADYDLEVLTHNNIVLYKKRREELEPIFNIAVNELNAVKSRQDELSLELKKMILQQDKISEIVQDRKIFQNIIKSEEEN